MKSFFKIIFIDTFRYFTAYRDYQNYKFIKEQIILHKDSTFFKKYDIFVNWWNELCILISLSREEIEISENKEVLEDGIFYDKLNEINGYVTNRMLLGDVLVPHVKRIPDSYSYVLKYKPYFNVLSKWWFIRNTLYICLLSLILYICF